MLEIFLHSRLKPERSNFASEAYPLSNFTKEDTVAVIYSNTNSWEAYTLLDIVWLRISSNKEII